MEAPVAFGDFVLNLETRELLRSGVPIRLSPKAFQLLGILVGHRPKALSKSDLQERLWPGTFVVDKNLTNLVGEIRDALGDAAGDPQFVRTVHRYGYAFQAPPVGTTSNVGRDSRMSARFRLVWTGARVALSDGAHVIGRDPDLELFLDSSSVSRHHARLTISGDTATLEDLGSKNGTFVGQRRIDGAAPVVDGDTIRVGSVKLTLRAVQAIGSTETGSIPQAD